MKEISAFAYNEHGISTRQVAYGITIDQKFVLQVMATASILPCTMSARVAAAGKSTSHHILLQAVHKATMFIATVLFRDDEYFTCSEIVNLNNVQT
jgi:hypothetical protein